ARKLRQIVDHAHGTAEHARCPARVARIRNDVRAARREPPRQVFADEPGRAADENRVFHAQSPVLEKALARSNGLPSSASGATQRRRGSASLLVSGFRNFSIDRNMIGNFFADMPALSAWRQ